MRNLLFDLTTWHAFAKLRIHMDMTLNDFRTLTSTLGRSVRIFINEVCSQYNTTKLLNEMATHDRRKAALAKKLGPPKASKKGWTSLLKKLNLSMYKYHALGDYPDQIVQFSATDNASTQTVRDFLQNIQNLFIVDLDTGGIKAQDDQMLLRMYK